MPKAKPASLDEPSSLTEAMGRRVKEAREQAGMSQAELASQIRRRQASVSDIENGKMEIPAGTLVQLAVTLKRPISYFFPWWVHRMMLPETLTPEQQSLLMYSEKLTKEDLDRLIIQVRALAEESERLYHDWMDQEIERRA
jgi:transcriptional regulator with XRE-family HTH domain